jgi:ATP-binding cassette subfamily B protein
MQVSAAAAVFGSLVVIAHRTVAGGITLGAMIMYFQAFQRGLGFIQQLLAGLAGLYEDSLFLNNLFEFLDLKPRLISPGHPEAFPKVIRRGIEFDGVGFTYPSCGRAALTEVNLTIAPGEIVALVGNNGSGKSTLVKLLCRLYDPDRGAIRIDEVDLRRLGTDSLRREIGVLFQDWAPYYVTARENIWFGNVALRPDDPRIAAAAGLAGAGEMISGLPRGYDTVLGRWFEEGVELSYGQWQTIALARAFAREAQIVILDEPSSSLDAATEAGLFDRFRELAAGRTAILISHRFSSVRMADRIVVMAEGRIVEAGSHAELMERQGKYAGMFNLQARHYR